MDRGCGVGQKRGREYACAPMLFGLTRSHALALLLYSTYTDHGRVCVPVFPLLPPTARFFVLASMRVQAVGSECGMLASAC